MVADRLHEGGQNWTPILPSRGSKLHADSHAAALTDYFAKSKGSWGIADFLAQCSEAEIPQWLRHAAVKLKDACLPAPAGGDQPAAPVAAEEHLEAVVHGSD